MDISDVLSCAPIIDVKFYPGELTELPNGFVGRTDNNAPESLKAYITEPNPKKLYTNNKGEQVVIDNVLYFSGKFKINIDDRFVYNDEFGESQEFIVRSTSYKRFGNYTIVGIKKQAGRVHA